MERGEFVWERIKHDDELFASRSEFFLVEQSLLVAAQVVLVTSTTAALSVGDRHVVTLLIAAVSIASIAIWVWTTLRHIWIRDELYKELDAHGSTFRRATGRSIPQPGAHVLMGVVLPIAFFVLWVVLPITTW